MDRRKREDDPPDSRQHEERDLHWHLDKKLNISHLIATAGIMTSLFVWGGKMDTRISLIEQQQASQQRTDERQDRDTKDGIIALRNDIASIASKLDRVIEARRN